ncbi:GspH/FimT family pseudopilin [Henriciella sp.]|jgi:general secretion pathway protein H|uniref:GspH/FimT family pseudopilin n=1 Tax=Henriciella sp. TaxID=1968823 RepID=UPI0025C4628F|nr:GspH/FimT family pseudopilin [Henriciella sp.]|tara:strand:+ start:766 stop:1233 length:468 start_codon:yes stop_codon:yes gene_type:complete
MLRRDAGLTLVEILVVIFVMGLVSAVAVMTLPARETPYERAVREVQSALRDAQDRAVLTGEVIGVQPTEHGLDLLSWTGEEWLPLRADRLSLPDGVRLEVVGAEDDRRDHDEIPQRIVFNPLGATQPVHLAVTWRTYAQRLTLMPDGEVVHGASS